MKKACYLLTVGLVFAVIMSMFFVNAAGKLSEYDFSNWEEVERHVLDFEDKTPDANYSEPPEGWRFFHGGGAHSKVVQGDNNKYLNFLGVAQLYLHPAINEQAYVFSIDLHAPTNQNIGIFARAGMERFPFEANQSDFYEHDRTGVTDGFSSLGGSGFYVRAATNKLKLYIKLYDATQPVKIGNALYEFDAGADFTAGYQTVTYVDNGSEVYIYVNDNLIASIEFSESKKYDIGEEDYYSKVAVKDAAGNKVGEHDNALFAVNSVVAFGNRSANVNIDNIKLTTYNIVEAPDTEPETPVNPETKDYFAFHILYLMLASALVLAIGKRRVNV